MDSPVQYIYLDDEITTEVRASIRSVELDNANLKVDLKHPMQYMEQIQQLKEWQKEGIIDGLILDLRLDQYPDTSTVDGHGQQANYRAATLAQEIRTRATEGEILDFPIVLWSTDKRLQESYYRDDTSHDLFDLKTVKASLEDADIAIRISRKLESLAKGYKFLYDRIGEISSQPYRLLGFDENPDFLDERVLMSFDSSKGLLPVHEYARFIVRQLLETPGPVINKNLLAARLGIDIRTSEDFEQLINTFFVEASYKGTFFEGWPCWWSALIDRTWKEFEGNPKHLRTMPAEERVEFIKNSTGLRRLNPALPLLGSKNTAYWTICIATQRPLDPRDGFLIERQPTFPWQDRQYVSLEAIVEGETARKGLRIDYLEQDRLEKAKKKL